jgi:tripartite-type tricarboxylate transporter receptor subunit TctC
MPNFRAGVWFGLLAPAATPPAIVEKLNRDIVRALQSPELKEKLAQQGADVTTSTPDEFHALIQDETALGGGHQELRDQSRVAADRSKEFADAARA